MSVFRTVRKIRECLTCHGTGKIYTRTVDETEQLELDCPECQGTGRVEIYARVSQTAAVQASAATKQLPPKERQEAKKRLKDHEPNARKEDFIEEE